MHQKEKVLNSATQSESQRKGSIYIATVQLLFVNKSCLYCDHIIYFYLYSDE